MGFPRGWSQADLARKTGIRASTIGDYYNELTDRINLRHFELICKALDCDLTDILVDKSTVLWYGMVKEVAP